MIDGDEDYYENQFMKQELNFTDNITKEERLT